MLRVVVLWYGCGYINVIIIMLLGLVAFVSG